MKTLPKLYNSQQATGDHTHRNHFICADTKVSRKKQKQNRNKTKANKNTIEKYNKKSAVLFQQTCTLGNQTSTATVTHGKLFKWRWRDHQTIN